MGKNLNLPNILTLTRILAAPVVVLLLYFVLWFGWKWAASVACILFGLACFTDLFDGMIARSQNIITNLGKFLDPLADKLLIGSVLIMLVRLGWAPAWVVIIIICREMSVTVMRAVAAEKGVVIAADKYGKLKTLAQCLALGPLIWHFPLLGWNPAPLGMVLLYIALGLTVFSGANYLYNFYKSWLQSD